MANVVELKQQFFPISNFRSVMKEWGDLLDYYPKKNTYTADNDQHSFEFTYQLLSNDVLILHQKTHCHIKHRMELIPRESGKFYTLKCLLKQNKAARLISNNRHYDMYQGMIAFFSNYANYVAELPEGYSEENLQIVISHSFIEEYINLRGISHPRLERIISEPNDLMFIIHQSPSSIKRHINKLVHNVFETSASSNNKLLLLKNITNILHLLFRLQVTDTRSASQESPLSENTAQKVATYLDHSLTTPFPGMDFLATTFGISVSGLKRHFKDEYNKTPFRYYRQKQMQNACTKLANTSLTVSDIALELGFATASNFIRAFKAEFDITPGQYRKQYSPEG